MSFIEHAARSLADRETALSNTRRTATPVDFVKLFAAVESDDDEANPLSEVLEILDARWPVVSFQASDITRFVNDPPQSDVDTAVKLRALLAPPGHHGAGNLLPNAVGRRLRAMLDAPVYVGDRVMALKQVENSGARKQAAFYQIRAV